ncbi:MAG: GGDEF domain-containing protein [Gammaproteobacteria bacterium]|nr:GGDEF domain-containing protein [Gammaproteobacteria bacterium]
MISVISEVTAFDTFLEDEGGAALTRESHLNSGQVLRLSSRLQSTLDVYTLIESFDRELKSLVQFSSVTYSNEALSLIRTLGNPAQHSLRYRLVLPDHEILGLIEVTSVARFSPEDIELIEFMISNLVYPLRNALLYYRAQQAAYKDSLTGFNNRAMFELSLEREISLARRHSSPLSLLCIDIDHFKKFNDLHGHLVGDKVLKAVAEGIGVCIRGSDVVFRYGGEEFVVLLSNTNIVGACNLAERIRRRISSSFCIHNDQQLAVTVSIGAVALAEEAGWREFFEKADKALYTAKRCGRNCVRTV